MRSTFSAQLLERRRLLAITVNGTAAADVIRIAADGGSILIVVNGVESRLAPDAAGIVVNAGDGNDTIRLEDASNLPVTINGQIGNDRVEIGNGNVRNARLTSVDAIGGVGTDTLVVDDTTASTANTAVTIDNPIDTYVSIVAAPGSIIRSDASNATNVTETVIYNGTALDDFIKVSGTNALVALNVNGLNGSDTVVLGDDIDTKTKGASTLDGGAGADVLTFDDSADQGLDTYTFANAGSLATVKKSSGGATTSYNSFANVFLNAGIAGFVPSSQTFRVNSLQDGSSVSIFAGSGDDALYVGNGVTSLDSLKADLNFFGQDDTDSIIYNDTLGSDAAAYELGFNYLLNAGTGTMSFFDSESIDITANGAANEINIKTLPDTLVTKFNANAGNDTIRVGNGDIDFNVSNGISIIGGAGTDALIIDDSTDDVGFDTYSIAAGSVRKNENAALQWSTASADRVESIMLSCSPNADTITVFSTTPAIALTIDAGPGDDVANVRSTTDATSTPPVAILFKSGSGNDTLDVNSDGVAADAIVNLYDIGEDLQNFSLRAGGRAKLAGGPTMVMHVAGVLTIAAPLDIADATMVMRPGSSGGAVNTLSNLAGVGYANGAWTGNGAAPAILSTTAATAARADGVGVGLASDVGLPVLNGVATLSGEVIVRYTLLGDATFDRIVNFDDLVVLSQNYNQAGRRWSQGNFDFDAAGNVNFDDLVSLAQNYNTSLPLVLAPLMTPKVTSAKGKVGR